MNPTYLTRPEAAEFLTARGFPIAKNTLQKMATTGGGPLYRRFGTRALYTADDLLKWAEGKCSAPRTSTSDAAQAA